MARNNKFSNDGSSVPNYDIHCDLIEFIRQAVEERDLDRIQDHVKNLHAADIAHIISVIDHDEREIFVRAISKGFDPEVLLGVEGEVKDDIIHALGAKESAKAITELDSDDAIQVIEDLEEDEQDEILSKIPKEKRGELEEGLSHPEETAGRRMDRGFVAIPANWDVGKTIDYLRKTPNLPDDFYSIFIVDKDKKPIGYVSVSRAMRQKRDVKVKSLMNSNLKTIALGLDQEDIAHIFKKYALSSAPIIDETGAMIGIINIDEIVDIIHEEAEEDILRMGGIAETDLYSRFMKTAMHRFPWLFINLITAIIASAVILQFEASIEKLVALAILMPIVASMAGNAGTQTLTVAVRAIATKDITSANALRVVRKEVVASLVNGVLLGALVGVVSYMFYFNLHLSIVFAISIFLALIIAAFSGAVIPLILHKFGIDPAISSGVLLTTITDITAFFIFLGLAAWMLV